jgi:Fe-S-cluster containining protein
MNGDASQPGLAGVVPFKFACHRCGHCCSHGDGHVWLADGEAERLAARLGLANDVFERRFVRTVPDPRTGELRRALVEEPRGSGRCVFLEGAKHCTVYLDRPTHCRTFPFWPSVLADADGFERARAVCPGIEPVVDPLQRERAFDELRAIYSDVDRVVANSRAVCIVRGVCCRFEEAGHRLYATALEADFAAATTPHAPPPEAPGRCPYHVAGRCTAREARPLGCRTYFCDSGPGAALEVDHEHFLARIRAVAERNGYPSTYASFPEQLRARGVGEQPS